MKIRIIGVPSAWGTMELGAQRTPQMLRDAGLADWLAAAGHQVEDPGDVDLPPQGAEDMWTPAAAAAAAAPSVTPASTDLLHVEQVAQMARSVRHAVAASLSDRCLPLVIGGECSSSIGVVAALAAHRGPVTVAWIDAHGDINTPETSPSGLVTGMPLAVTLGHGHPSLTAVGEDTERPHGGSTFLLGGRDLDAGEIDNLEAFGVRHIDTAATRAAGPEEMAMQVLGVPEIAVMPPEARDLLVAADPAAAAAVTEATAAGTAVNADPRPNVYLHIDVDALDPEFAPGVHYRVDGGFDPSEVGTLAGYLCASGRVGAITLASANFDHDIDGRTVNSIREVFASMVDALAMV